MTVSTKEMLKSAQAGGYAVPAINTNGGNYDIIQACCMAAEEAQSPMILAHYVATGAYSGHGFFVEVAKWCGDKVSVPVAIHLDHGGSFATCMMALKNRFTSIMYDGSALSIEENAKNTNEICKVAREFGVPVEAEIGELVRLDSGNAETANIARIDDVKRYLELCSPDSLAVGIGNAHGYYVETPVIRLDVLAEVRKITDVPLVLHGCTGMSDDVVKEAIKTGVAKINFGTLIRYKYVEFLTAVSIYPDFERIPIHGNTLPRHSAGRKIIY